MTSVLTPPVVQALGDELVTQLREEPDIELDLELPSGAWSVYILVPGKLEEGHADVGVQVFLKNVPGGGSSWKVQIGAMNANALGGDRNPSYPDSDHGVYDRTGKITGDIVPAASPDDIPRVIAWLAEEE